MKKLKLISLLCALVLVLGSFAAYPISAVDYATDGAVSNWVLAENGGTGTESDPYILTNANFKQFVTACDAIYNVNNSNTIYERTLGYAYAHYKLGEDIVVNQGVASNWNTASGREGLFIMGHPLLAFEFEGSFDGDGHSISGICMVAETNRTGLFAQNSGVVQNLRIVNSYYESAVSGAEIGAIASRVGSSYNKVGVINNCYVDAIFNCSNANYVGGIAAFIPAKTENQINNCVFAGEIQVNKGSAGGILGAVNWLSGNKVSNCINLGSINSSATVNMGAIVGYIQNNLVIENCINLSTELSNNSASANIFYGSNSNNDNVTISNPIIVKGFETDYLANNKTVDELTKFDVKEISLAALLNSENKVFSTWNYADGYIPTPVPAEYVKIAVSDIVTDITAELIGLKSEGNIHSIRISTDNPGLRFITFVDQETLDILGAEVISMKTYITAAKFIGEDSETTTATFTKEALDQKGMPCLEVEAKEYLYSTAEGDEYTAFAGSVVNVNDLTMKYIAVGCITIKLSDESTKELYASWSIDEATDVCTIAELAEADYSTEKNDEKKHVNLITTHSGDSVYSRYTQEQYDIIVKLCCLQ